MFPTFEIFGKEIGMYGVMTIIGAAFCVLVGYFLIKKFGITWMDMALVMIAALIGILVVSHIVYGISNIPKLAVIIQNIGKLTFIQFITLLGECFGGMVFYGGFIGGALGVIKKKKKIDKSLNTNEFLDIYAVLIPLFHTFGRIGCFLGGCCYGIESDFGFTVHNNTLNQPIPRPACGGRLQRTDLPRASLFVQKEHHEGQADLRLHADLSGSALLARVFERRYLPRNLFRPFDLAVDKHNTFCFLNNYAYRQAK